MNESYFGITDLGRLRDNNEDAFLLEHIGSDDRILAAVIDGVGGYEGGEVAADIAKQCISELAAKSVGHPDAALSTIVLEINNRIIQAKKSHPGKESMACVLTIALADTAANQFHYAHVGDTRLYLLRGQSLVKVSKDHSFVGFLEESNRITEQNAMRHPKRNEVNKVLGADPNISTQQDYIDKGTSPFLPGDLLLLCSDGLSDMIDSQQITAILKGAGTVQDKAKGLIEAANQAGGRDNVTVVLVQHPKAPTSHKPTEPAAKKKPTHHPDIIADNTKETVKWKGNNSIVWILSIVCIGLAGALVWMYLQQQRAVTITNVSPPHNPVVHHRNTAEQQLFDVIIRATDSLVVDTVVFKKPVLVTDTLLIDKDTFRLSGNGIVLCGDSLNHGPCLVLSAAAGYIVLENMIFQDFPIAIAANNNALVLRNVQFRNCRISVDYAFHFPDSISVQGFVHEGAPFNTNATLDNH